MKNLKSIYPFDKNIKSASHSAQYRMHKYFARRPYNVFHALIEHYTKPNDIVLDVFCGGGVTIFESLSLNRKAIGVDLNPLATFITKMQITKINILELKNYLYSFIEEVEKDFGFFYSVEDGVIEWIEWAYKVECPYCKSEILLKEDNKIRNGIYMCPNDKCFSNLRDKKGVKRTDCKPLSSEPIKTKIRKKDSKNAYIREIKETEKKAILAFDYQKYLRPNMIQPNAKIPDRWDRSQEDKLNSKGVFYFKDLFTNRNYVLNVILFNKILELKKDQNDILNECLYFAFSASLRYTNNMTRVLKNWENGNPTSMDKHAYWLPNQYIETNVFDKLKNRIEAVIKGLNYANEKIPYNINKAPKANKIFEEGNYLILNQSSSSLPLDDKSVDSIITDPPYGSNVQYGELSAYWNLWLKYYKNLDSFIYNNEEAIMNRKNTTEKFKDLNYYENMLYKVFKECNRVLKDDGYLVFTFNNKNIKVWIALLKAIAKANFYLPKDGVFFQNSIQSYNNTSHLHYSGNVQGDFVYSFKKGTPKKMFYKNVKTENIEVEITNSINNTIENLFKLHESYTTSELYKNIFTNLINIIIDLIHRDLQTDENKLAEIEKYSNNFIDNYLNSKLEFLNNKWYLKG